MRFSRALVVGSTGGIGSALFAALEGRVGPANVVGLSRGGNGLDLTSEASVESVMSRLEPGYDLIFVASGALTIDGRGPEKSLRQVDPRALRDQFALNALGPLLVLKHGLRLMPRDRPAAFAALSARVGSIGDNRLGGWYGYRAAKAALNQLLRTAAVEVARSHPQAVVAALHPGTVATRFTRDWVAPDTATPPEAAAENLLDVLEALDAGRSGGFFDYAGREIPF